jgi:eukaryotic-like serine/threonine-protein kinase
MSEPQSSQIERLLDEFVERLRQGQSPSISEYERAHPACAQQIRELFPAVQTMEEMARRRQYGRPAAVTRPAVPQRLGDYRILCEIGRGGMGVVYEAEQESLGRHVAVKVLPQCALLGPQTLQRFHREARMAARLHHTNIVPVFGVGEDQDFHYIVMQLIQGVGLDKVLLQLAGGCVVEVGADRGCSASQPSGVKSRSSTDATAVARALFCGEFWPALRASDSASGPIDVDARTAKPGSSSIKPQRALRAADTKPFPASTSGPVAAAASHTAAAPDPSSAVARPLAIGTTYWQSVARIGAQAAQALHYAHACGTLHRDIKPANLLLDLQGVVWITDFGLAKAMEQDEVSRAGDIVGTLRYLAPERFQGHADARSDIYSLGLSLYEMLTLRPAFEHSQPSDLMRRITTEAPPRPRAVNPKIPRDLETIVLKAIAREPAQRYPSALELAEDLERFLEDRPICARRFGVVERLWRWSRSNQAVASLTALAVALLMLVAVVASIGYVRTKIANRQVREALVGESQQRRIAESQRQKAETLSDLTLEALGDVFEQFAPSRVIEGSALAFDDPSEGEILVPAQPVLSPEAAALLDRMLVFYDRLAQQNPSDPRLRTKVADASRRVGDIRRRLGHFEQAKAAYLQAIERYRQLEVDAVADPMIATEMARIYNELGNLAWTARWQGEGRPCHMQAMAVLKAASATSAALPQSRYELARTYYFLGRGGPPDKAPGRRPQGDSPPARPQPDRHAPPARNAGESDRPPPADRDQHDSEENLQQAIQILEGLNREHPLDPDYRHLLACCYRDLPSVEPESAAQFPFGSTDKAIEILQQLVDDFPSVPDYRHDLSKTYAKLDLRDRQSDAQFYAAAEARLGKAMRISEQLVAEHPNVPDYVASQVQVLYTLSEVLRHTRRPDDAESTLRRALAAQSALAEQYPRAVPYQSWKAILQESLARLLANRGQAAEARAIQESSIAAMEQLLQREPQAAYVHVVLGRSYANLATVLKALGEEQQAAEMLRRASEHSPDRPPQ